MSDETGQSLEQRHKSGGATIRVLILGAVALGAVAFVLGVWRRIQQGRELTAQAQQAHRQIAGVEYVSPHTAFDGELVLPANIQAVSDTTIYSRAAGYVVGLYVDIGSHVNAGQLLAK